MKILFFGTHFPRPNNPTMATWALSQVVALREAGHQVQVISPIAAIPGVVSKVLRRGTSSTCPPRHRWQGIEAHYVRWPVYPVGPLARWLQDRPDLIVQLAARAAAGKFRGLAREFAPDIIFAHVGWLAGFAAAQLARELKIPFAITEHDFADIESCAGNRHRMEHYGAAIRSIGRWIAVADRMSNSMRALFPEAPIVTVHNGAEAIPQDIRDAPRPSAWVGRKTVLSVSFLYARKNVPLLIRAFDRAAARNPDAHLIVIGDGEDKPAVLAAIASAQHRAQIEFLGVVPHRQVIQTMVWCDVFASIGRNEPFATVFSEAMMAGKPIVYASDGGITDVVRSGVHGLGVAPNDEQAAVDALHQLLENDALRTQLGAQAAHLATTQLTWAENARNITRVFEQCIREHGR